MLRENFDAILRYMQFCEQKAPNGIRPENGYGDWLNVDSETDKSVIATAYYAYSAMLTSKICAVLGKFDLEIRFRQLYEKIRKAFCIEFVDPQGRIRSDTQTAYLLAYSFGLRSGTQIRSHLLDTLARANYHLTTGFVGIKFLLPVLCEIGCTDLAYDLITKESYPSWGYTVRNGATTIWERWNSYTISGGFEDRHMNSFNHYAFGSCAEWLYRYVLGIRADADAPGFKRTIFRPYIDKTGRILHVAGEYHSREGKISVKWDWQDEVCTYRADYPENMGVCFEFNEFEVLSEVVENGSACFTLKNIS